MAKPDIRDVHIYGGLALAAWGAYVQFGAGACMLLVGAAFWYVGVHRMRTR